VCNFLEDSFKYSGDTDLIQAGGADKFDKETTPAEIDQGLTYNKLEEHLYNALDVDTSKYWRELPKLVELNPMNDPIIEGNNYNNGDPRNGLIDDKEHEIEIEQINEGLVLSIWEKNLPQQLGSPIKTEQEEDDEDLHAFFDAYNNNPAEAFQPPEDCFQHENCLTLAEYEELAAHFFNYLQIKYGPNNSGVQVEKKPDPPLWEKEEPFFFVSGRSGGLERLQKIEEYMFNYDNKKYPNSVERDRRLYNILSQKCAYIAELKPQPQGPRRCIFNQHPHITPDKDWIPSRTQWAHIRNISFKNDLKTAVENRKEKDIEKICNDIRTFLNSTYKKDLSRVKDIEIIKQVLDPAQLNLNYNKNRVKVELSAKFNTYLKTQLQRSGRYDDVYHPIGGKLGRFNKKYYPDDDKKMSPQGSGIGQNKPSSHQGVLAQGPGSMVRQMSDQSRAKRTLESSLSDSIKRPKTEGGKKKRRKKKKTQRKTKKRRRRKKRTKRYKKKRKTKKRRRRKRKTRRRRR